MGERAEPFAVIEPSRGRLDLRLAELWTHRELLGFFIWRDVRVRYKQTALGALWAIVQPVSSALVLAFFLGHLARVPSDGLPPTLFYLSGLFLWGFFSQAVVQASASLVASANLIKKVYFPRLIIPLGAVGACAVDLLPSSLVIAGFTLSFGYPLSARALLLVPLAALTGTAAAGLGTLLGALHVRYRDVKYLAAFLVQLLLFASPVLYPASLVTRRLEAAGIAGWLYGLNPMVGAIEGARWALLGTSSVTPGMVAASSSAAVLLAVVGVCYFRSVERAFADVV